MAALEFFQFPYLSDNYGVLVHDPESGSTASIDAGDAAATKAALAKTGWNLTHILVTHHHGDHTAGLSELKAETGATVIGPQENSKHIKGLDQYCADGDSFLFGNHEVKVIFTPGHTTDIDRKSVV